jgi:hypothetical protein
VISDFRVQEVSNVRLEERRVREIVAICFGCESVKFDGAFDVKARQFDPVAKAPASGKERNRSMLGH